MQKLNIEKKHKDSLPCKTPSNASHKTGTSVKKPVRSTEDLGDDIVGAAAVDDVIGDDDDSCLNFILGLAAAGIVFSVLAMKCNPGNTTVQLGIYIYWAGYAVLLSRIIPLILIAGGLGAIYMNLFEAGNIPYTLIFGGMGAGALVLLMRYLIPTKVMSIIQKTSWVLMFLGPIIMTNGGADKTGPLCIVVSAIWLIIFAFAAAISAIFSKISGN